MNNYLLVHGSFGSPFANTIATKEIIIDNGGYLNSESGYTEFKELLEFI